MKLLVAMFKNFSVGPRSVTDGAVGHQCFEFIITTIIYDSCPACTVCYSFLCAVALPFPTRAGNHVHGAAGGILERVVFLHARRGVVGAGVSEPAPALVRA